MNGQCIVDFDAFYLFVVISLVVGVLWLITTAKTFKYLADTPNNDWLVYKLPSTTTATDSTLAERSLLNRK